MLKIKDNVDLKELEKFGFKKESKWFYCKRIDNNWWDTINVSTDGDKEIYRATEVCGYSEIDYDIEEFINDLIKADLVEKVGE